MALTPAQRTMRARLAAHKRWSQEDPHANAVRAQAGLLDRFRRDIIAEQGDVAEPELTRRAESRRREHMTRIAFKRSKAGKAASS
jgi:hypothetical protein